MCARSAADSRCARLSCPPGACRGAMRVTDPDPSDTFGCVRPRLAVVPACSAPDPLGSVLGGGVPTPVPLQLFAGHARDPIPHRLDLGEVRAMLDEGRFWTEYQPIIHARTGRTVAFESLARFRRRDGRLAPPAKV